MKRAQAPPFFQLFLISLMIIQPVVPVTPTYNKGIITFFRNATCAKPNILIALPENYCFKDMKDGHSYGVTCLGTEGKGVITRYKDYFTKGYLPERWV